MDYREHPIDPESADRLASRGLRLGLVDANDRAAAETWAQVVARGFHAPIVDVEQRDDAVRSIALHRTTGVWDATSATPDSPVATVTSWPSPLTVPGETTLDAWAISAVTVAPTHRRRGIARAMLESELRTAAGLGLPLAMLTVSEATIYGRYGFAPAARACDLTINCRRTLWAGPEPAGRIHFLSLGEVREQCRSVFEEARRRTPGDVGLDDSFWAELLLLEGPGRKKAEKHRAVRYDDADGTPRGFAVYAVDNADDDFAERKATLQYLCAATDDAYAALWRFVIELDLVDLVEAPLRSVDEPVIWMLDNQRAAHITRTYDHLWVRLLDAPAALRARRYGRAGRFVLRISDPLGFAPERVMFETDGDGTARVKVLGAGEAAPTGAVEVSLGIGELGALYLGGVSASTLARAGRLRVDVPGAANTAGVAASAEGAADAAGRALAVVDGVFRSGREPWLSTWF